MFMDVEKTDSARVLNRFAHGLTAFLFGVASLLLAVGGISPVQAEDEGAGALGDFRPMPAMTLYLPAGDQVNDLRLSLVRAQYPQGDRLMIRLFDPEERLAYWQYFEPGLVTKVDALGDCEITDIPLDMTIKPRAGTILADLNLSLNAPGIWQLRISAGTNNTIAKIFPSLPLRYGVSFQNGTFSTWDKTLKEAYLYIPPHARKLQLRGGPVRIFDENGKELTSAQGADVLPKDAYNYKAKIIEIPIEKTGVVWKFSFPNPADWSLRMFGVPAILCPDAETAMLIKGSVEVLPDGTTVCHKFQREIAKLMPEILAKAGSSDELLSKFLVRKEQWLEHPQRNSSLLSAYGIWPLAAEAVREQNTDPSSHWAGAVKLWKDRVKLPAPDNRWDDYLTVSGSSAGLSDHSSYGEALAEVWALDAPFNKLYHNDALLYRAAAVALSDLMDLGEDEVFRGMSADMDPYPGFMAFAICRKNIPEYSVIAQALPETIRNVWTDGLRRVVDRHYPDGLVTCRNQSAHYLVGLQQFATGSQDPRYHDLAERYIQRYIEGQSPAGYGIESFGPDASYTGMQHWHMAYAQLLSGSNALLEAIRRSYNFFNHTIAPEPDGNLVGGFNFGHRIGGSFRHEQWGGAKYILSDKLPEIAAWNKYLPYTSVEQCRQTIEQTFERGLTKPAGLIITLPHYLFWKDKGLPNCDLPALSDKDFIHEIGTELVGVKRPAYYAAVFVGKPAPTPNYISSKEKARHARPDADENNGGLPAGRSKYNTPFLGGGLTLLWSPSYGAVFAAGNWSAYTHHGLIALKQDQSRWWEDYFATTYQLDKEAGVLTVSGKVEGTPVRYVRRYSFMPDRVVVALELVAEDACTFERFTENFPYVAGAPKVGGVKLAMNPDAESAQNSGFSLTCRGVTVPVKFAESVQTTACENGLNDPGQFQINRVEADLPRTWIKGQRYHFSYEIIPPIAEKSE